MNRSMTERPLPLKRPAMIALGSAWVLCMAVGAAVALRPASGGRPQSVTDTRPSAPSSPSLGTPAAPTQGFTPARTDAPVNVMAQPVSPSVPQTASPAPAASPVLSSPAPYEPPVTPAKETAVPVTKANAPAPVHLTQHAPAGMPPDVMEWLKHLERTENRRRELARSQTGALLAEFSGMIATGYSALADPDEVPSVTAEQRSRNIQRLKKRVQEYRTEWDRLSVSFWSVKAPDVCSRAATDFGQTLGQTSQMMNEVFGFVTSGEDSPRQSLEGLYKMTGTSAGRVDSPALAADRDVQAVCDRYDVTKWFSIQGDVGGGMAGILGRLGG
ncbi:MAG: hypothetical protein JST30_07155 [Armatimonadetes bacterium]|nr:hypothetical protein [Armatimonadota bacterium]